jgi:tetratricopeptide (TPR) repeat protein
MIPLRIATIAITMTLLIACSQDNERPSIQVAPQKSSIQVLQEQVASNPRDSNVWFHLADLYDRSQMYPEEIEALKKVIALKPKEIGYAYEQLGTAYNRLGKYQEAVGSFLKARDHSPKNPVIYNNLAASYGMIGKTNEQMSALKKAIALRPHYATARYNLGIVFLKKGKRDEALKEYQNLKKFDEGTAQLLKKEIDAKRK